MARILSIVAFAAVSSLGLYFFWSRDDFTVPPPAASSAEDFVIPKPSVESIISIPVSVDLMPAISEALAEIENPIVQGSEVINVPSALHLERDISKWVREETKEVCAKTERKCQEFEDVVERVCRWAPWPVNEVCDDTKDERCKIFGDVCVASNLVTEVVEETTTPMAGPGWVKRQAEEVLEKFVNVDADVDYAVNLVDANINFVGTVVSSEFFLEYRLRLNNRLSTLEREWKVVEVNGVTSCGYDEPMRKVKVVITARMQTHSDLRLELGDESWSIIWQDSCQLTAFDIKLADILDLKPIKSIFRSTVDKALEKFLNEQNEALSFQDKIDDIWPRLATPIEIDDEAWLALNLSGVSVKPINGRGRTLSTTVGIKAFPVLSSTPFPSSTLPPIPTVDVGGISPGIALNAAASLDFKTLQDLINTKLAQEENFPVLGQPIPIDAQLSRIYAAEGGGVVLAVRLLKPIKATVYLEGAGVIDEDAGKLRFPDLDYSLFSRNALLEVGDELWHGLLKDFLRATAEVDLEAYRAEALEKYADYTVEPKQPDDPEISFSIGDVELTDFSVGPDAIHLLLSLIGEGNVHIPRI